MKKFPELEKYFEKEYNKLVQKVTRRAGGPENAEDVVQEAFYRACKYWSSYNPETKIGAWFNSILVNACRDKMRDNRMLGMTVEIEEDQFDPVDMSEQDFDTARKVQELIREKRQPYQEILRLYYEKGYKPVEIRDIVEADHNVIRQTIFVFKQEVKEKLGE